MRAAAGGGWGRGGGGGGAPPLNGAVKDADEEEGEPWVECSNANSGLSSMASSGGSEQRRRGMSVGLQGIKPS